MSLEICRHSLHYTVFDSSELRVSITKTQGMCDRMAE
jgi:hypothetical protein